MEQVPSFNPAQPPNIDYVLCIYNSRVAGYVAMTMVVADLFPKEILNEIRSSYTHLAKASALEPQSEEYFEETKSALRHLKRASLDCLKVAILVIAQKADRNVDSLNGCLRLPEEIHKTASSLRADRREVLGHEAAHPSNDTIDNLERLFLRYDDFNSRLVMEYGGERAEAAEQNARRKQRVGTFYGFLTGIAASVVASYIFGILPKL